MENTEWKTRRVEELSKGMSQKIQIIHRSDLIADAISDPRWLEARLAEGATPDGLLAFLVGILMTGKRFKLGEVVRLLRT